MSPVLAAARLLACDPVHVVYLERDDFDESGPGRKIQVFIYCPVSFFVEPLF